jgi:DNA-binding GntR family transcriptional regulator
MARATPTNRAAAKDRALDYVKRRVLTAEFPDGELISEGEVAAAIGMSRTPVREAFLRLEADGLLYPQRGALVLPVSPQEVRAVMEARLLLEQIAVRKLLEQGDTVRDKAFAAMAREIELQRAATEYGLGLEEFLEADRRFHTVLLDCSRNTLLTDFYGSLRDRQMRMVAESAIRDSRTGRDHLFRAFTHCRSGA